MCSLFSHPKGIKGWFSSSSRAAASVSPEDSKIRIRVVEHRVISGSESGEPSSGQDPLATKYAHNNDFDLDFLDSTSKQGLLGSGLDDGDDEPALSCGNPKGLFGELKQVGIFKVVVSFADQAQTKNRGLDPDKRSNGILESESELILAQCWRRYSDFNLLRTKLGTGGKNNNLPFPKKTLFSTRASTLEARKLEFERFLNAVDWGAHIELLNEFLGLPLSSEFAEEEADSVGRGGLGAVLLYIMENIKYYSVLKFKIFCTPLFGDRY